MELTISRKLKFHIPGCSTYTPLECGIYITKNYPDDMSAAEAQKLLKAEARQTLAQEILDHTEMSVGVLTEEDFDTFVDNLLNEVEEDG
jgi:tripartite-type tricarboxylate transporter receptor subunit TctC